MQGTGGELSAFHGVPRTVVGPTGMVIAMCVPSGGGTPERGGTPLGGNAGGAEEAPHGLTEVDVRCGRTRHQS